MLKIKLLIEIEAAPWRLCVLCNRILKSTNVKWLCLNRFMEMENQFDYFAD